MELVKHSHNQPRFQIISMLQEITEQFHLSKAPYLAAAWLHN
jgi:hypothetical protein